MSIALYLAPMAGFTDVVFRGICKRFGADFLVTEFVQSEAILRERDVAWRAIEFPPEQRPIGVQIFGSVPESMARAAQVIAEKIAPDFIDLNFGCPAPKVVGTNAGSGLLRDLPLLEKIARAVVQAVPATRVTAKMRLGWNRENLVHIEVAKRLEAAGIQAICVHGRTRAQGYSGTADWQKIAEVVDSVSVPVIGNGDISSAEIAVQRVRETGVSGLMIGRAALGNPWIFREIRAALDANFGVPAKTAESLGNGDTLVADFKNLQKVDLNSGDKSVAVPKAWKSVPAKSVPARPSSREIAALVESYALAICGNAPDKFRANIAKFLPFFAGTPGSKQLRSRLATSRTFAEFLAILRELQGR